MNWMCFGAAQSNASQLSPPSPPSASSSRIWLQIFLLERSYDAHYSIVAYFVVAREEHTPMDEAEEFARKTVDILNGYTNELNAMTDATMAAKNRAQIPNLKDVL
jgi:hypothetical protein